MIRMSRNRMFPLPLRTETVSFFSTLMNDTSWLWHLRFGHLNFNGLQFLAKNDVVTGLPLLEKSNQVCEGCILGKQHRDSFQMGKARRATQQLELVHSDICRPMEVESQGGNRYFISFIDDYSRKI